MYLYLNHQLLALLKFFIMTGITDRQENQGWRLVLANEEQRRTMWQTRYADTDLPRREQEVR